MRQIPMLPVRLTLALATSAWVGVEVLGSAGLVEQEVWGAPSPVPEC